MPRVFEHIVGMDPSFTSFGVACNGESKRIVTTPVAGATDSLSTILRCDQIIDQISEFIPRPRAKDGEQLWVIEAPMLRVPMHGGSHLYQLGFLMSRLYELSVAYLPITVLEVSNSALLKTLFGNGRVDKSHLALEAYRKLDMSVVGPDPGNDQLYARLLAQYGVLFSTDTIAHIPAKQRGTRAKKVAA